MAIYNLNLITLFLSGGPSSKIRKQSKTSHWKSLFKTLGGDSMTSWLVQVPGSFCHGLWNNHCLISGLSKGTTPMPPLAGSYMISDNPQFLGIFGGIRVGGPCHSYPWPVVGCTLCRRKNAREVTSGKVPQAEGPLVKHRVFITSWWLNQPLWTVFWSNWIMKPQVGVNI